MKRTTVLPALFLALALAVTGCGGGDDGKSTDTPTAAAITQAEFITQADAICKAGNATIDAAATAVGDNPSAADIELFVTSAVIPGVQAQHDSIDALGAPEGDEDQIAALLAALQTGIDNLTADPGAITTAEGSPFAEANQLASDYGLQECGAE